MRSPGWLSGAGNHCKDTAAERAVSLSVRRELLKITIAVQFSLFDGINIFGTSQHHIDT